MWKGGELTLNLRNPLGFLREFGSLAVADDHEIRPRPDTVADAAPVPGSLPGVLATYAGHADARAGPS